MDSTCNTCSTCQFLRDTILRDTLQVFFSGVGCGVDDSTTDGSSAQSRQTRRFMDSFYSNLISDGISTTEGLDEIVRLEVENFTALLPTVWFGSDNGW